MVRAVRGLLMVLSAVAVSGAYGVAGAQQPDPTDVEVSGAELERFANAYVAVLEIGEAMEAELASVQSQEEAQAIQEEARREMVEALEARGLTVARYQVIARLVNTDPELQAEFLALLEELQSGGSTS